MVVDWGDYNKITGRFSLVNLSLFICDSDGEYIESYDIDGTISVAIPNVGDSIWIEAQGRREVSRRTFLYLPDARGIQVTVYLKEW